MTKPTLILTLNDLTMLNLTLNDLTMLNLTLAECHDTYEDILFAIRSLYTSTTANTLTSEICV